MNITINLDDFSYDCEQRTINLKKFQKKYGYSIIPVSYWEPIPSLDGIDIEDITAKDVLMPIDFQYDFSFVASLSASLCNSENFPEYIKKNPMFPLGDINAYIAMIKFYQPSKIIEIGGGYSTCASYFAVQKLNLKTEIICIEPEPNNHLIELSHKGRVSLLKMKVQDISQSELKKIKSLKDNDILFIDTSHINVRGSDTNFIFIKLFPLLCNNVLIHVHDIFLPYDYYRGMYYKAGRFYTEQY
ncbi:MAG: class I SAM-dependent methyltransferase, partial [Nanoarchaeota archaeon]|nr:class I SAM-dependent methyltransferase [Nanoarchaeota archaeon]